MALVLLATSAVACSGAASDDEPSKSPSPVASVTAEPETETLSIQGSLAVSPAHAVVGDGVCMAWGDYTDFNLDAPQVVITDATGTTVGVGEVGAVEAFQDGCLRWFEIDVPAGGSFYTATVGPWSSRAYPEADLDSTSMVILVDG